MEQTSCFKNQFLLAFKAPHCLCEHTEHLLTLVASVSLPASWSLLTSEGREKLPRVETVQVRLQRHAQAFTHSPSPQDSATSREGFQRRWMVLGGWLILKIVSLLCKCRLLSFLVLAHAILRECFIPHWGLSESMCWEPRLWIKACCRWALAFARDEIGFWWMKCHPEGYLLSHPGRNFGGMGWGGSSNPLTCCICNPQSVTSHAFSLSLCLLLFSHNQQTTAFRHPVSGQFSPENSEFFLQEE